MPVNCRALVHPLCNWAHKNAFSGSDRIEYRLAATQAQDRGVNTSGRYPVQILKIITSTRQDHNTHSRDILGPNLVSCHPIQPTHVASKRRDGRPVDTCRN